MKPYLILLILPLLLKGQSHRDEYTTVQSIGLTAATSSIGLHYNWQSQVSKSFYGGMGAEALRAKAWASQASLSLSWMPATEGVRPVLFTRFIYVLSQPTGIGGEWGGGMAFGPLLASASYRRYSTKEGAEVLRSGVYVGVSYLFIKEAVRPRF